MYKVLVADNVEKEALEVFKDYKDIQVDIKTGLPPEELSKIIGDYDGLIVRSATQFKGEVINKAAKMKVVGRAGAGVDNIDVELSSKKGIIVMNTPGGNSSAVAELTIALMLCLSRNIAPANMAMKNGKWEKNIFAKTSVEVAGKTLGILGAGNIGTIVADRAKGLLMEVIVYDPFLTDEKASQLAIKKVNSIDEIYKNSDYITLHLPKNEQTVNLINKDAFDKMKKGVYIINCARGGIINEKDLLDALNSGKVKAAAIDVYEKEPPEPNNPLVMHPNVTCTPHLGASSVEAQMNVAIAIAKQIGDYLTKGEVKNAVNSPNLDAITRKLIDPYIKLAQKIGLLYGQFAELNIKEIEVIFEGEVCKFQTAPIIISLLIGLLQNSKEGINFVNAQFVAKEMGIKVVETKNPESLDYASQITLVTKYSGGQTKIKGAVFKEGLYRIVEIDDFALDFAPEGNLLLTLNKDIPGFIGKIGTVIGNAGLNISNMELGRNLNLKKALSFIQIDGDIPDKVIDEISKIDSLEKVYRIKMG
jgi:D-3-phosphoglycerate dehydrogenase